MPRKSLRTRTDTDIEGNGYVAVATNKGIIRFFSGGGMQRGPVWAVDGDVVAMVAGRDYLFVVHREGGTSLDGRSLSCFYLMTVSFDGLVRRRQPKFQVYSPNCRYFPSHAHGSTPRKQRSNTAVDWYY